MTIEEKIASIEAELDSLKQELNTRNKRPSFKVGEVYNRKGSEHKYALTYLDDSEWICIINLSYGTKWKTILSDYQSKNYVKRPKRTITWSEMEYLTGNKANEFTLLQTKNNFKFFIEEEEWFLKYNKENLWHLENESIHRNLRDFGQTYDLFYEAIGQYNLEITVEHD